MRSSSVFGVALTAFLVGLAFYHYFLFLGQFSLPINYTFKHNTRGESDISLEEYVKGPLAQNDTRVVKYIREHYLHPPSPKDYNLTNEDLEDPSMGQSKLVRRALHNMKNGFFVECGALDGEIRSNTLHLEKYLRWTGLLIEGDPKNFELLVQKNRKAWASDSCLATKPYPHHVVFEQDFNKGRISGKELWEESPNSGFVRVQCFPFFSLMSALNVTTVDYFSLDVEGSELDVLKTIPFHSIYIKVLSVEYIHDKGGRDSVKKFMTSKGYRVFGEVTDSRNWANDLIFLHYNLTVH